MAQLKSASERDLYNRKKSSYPKSIKIEKDIEFEKSYEVEKIIDKRQRKYNKFIIIEYLIR